MKDKRLDVFFEHCSFRICKYLLEDQGSKWCNKVITMDEIKKFPPKVNCNGDIAKCELEG